MRHAGKILGTIIGALYAYIRCGVWLSPDPVWLYMIPGALLGFVFGAVFDKKIADRKRMYGWEETRDDSEWWKWWKSEFNKTTWKKLENEQTKVDNEKQAQTEDAFNRALAVLAAGLAQADGEVTDKEISRVRKFFIDRFGYKGAEEWVKIFEFQAMQSLDIRSYCASLENELGYAARLHLFEVLNSIATADSKISPETRKVLNQIADGLKIDLADRGPAEFTTNREDEGPYGVLGLRRGASRDEVRRSFHKLALQYHPDKVAHLGEKYVREAEIRFRKIKEAYDEINGG